MIDCGHSTTTAWRPGTYLRQQGIAKLDMLAVTSYDEDYVSGSQDLFNSVSVRWLLHNFSLNGTTLRTLDGDAVAGGGTERLSREIDGSFSRGRLSADPLLFGLRERRCYYNRYPEVTDRNNLGTALYLNCHGVGVMFAGAVEEKGLLELLKIRVFREDLQSTHVYITPSSGTVGAAADAVAAHLKHVYYVVISDRGPAQGAENAVASCRRIAWGGPFRQDARRQVLTTQADGNIGFTFRPEGWSAF